MPQELTNNQLVVREPQLSSRASAARKAAPTFAAPDHCALVDSARAHHGKSCKAVTEAEAGVKTAKAALEAAPRDPRERAVAREALVMAEEDLEAAKTAKSSAEQHLQATERARDEADAATLGKGLSRAAQAAEADALCKLFEQHVVGGMRTFLTALVDRRVALLTQARALQAIWARLGNDFRIPGVDVELGTGTATVPPTVSLDGLTAIESLMASRLKEQFQQRALAKDHLGRAALQFVLVALAPEHREHHSGRALHELVWERVIAAGGKAK
jgi:hypothetical protein